MLILAREKCSRQLGDLSRKDLLELRASVNRWAKDQGFTELNYKGVRVENSSSANPGMVLDWTIDLTKIKVMIQNENEYLEFVNSDMNYEDVIHIVKNKGATQITCTKIVMKIYNLSLSKANEIVQNSIHWSSYKSGNDHLRQTWFSKDD
ncbi:hypothetical protein [Fluviicola sp.]|uniref:hypothetical protein n=1 Tax=Fluviicola sp. TaxID=1917219 RepID=UPI0026373FCD|nr:hypothetical protein [Fluviicola sp.]